MNPITIIKALRPKQWAKNGLLLVAMVFAEKYDDPESWMNVAVGVAMFCMLSSAGYLVNDVRDIEADRKHPKKKHRPIASGAIPVGMAWGMVVVLIAAGLAGSWFLLNQGFFIVAAGYLLSTLSYTIWFKHAPVLDVMLIANGFLLRAVAGAEAIDAPSSPWFLVCIGFGALFIGLGKRLAEIKLLSKDAGEHRKVLAEYSIDMLQQFITITVACSMISYALYTFGGGHDSSMMLTLPFFIYGVFRYLYLVEKGEGGDPTSIFVGDKPLLICMALFVAVAIAVLQLGNGAAG
ncbi:MAG: decaprenyl-phosphate phosphoribosyltransferase [Proteobacteria bacterium]|nr:decaprenyl-phosphate phosphoribosyltransferase [Pseudomonadota bacterium]